MVYVNTANLNTKFKIILHEEEQMSKVLEEVAKKRGEDSLNPKQYSLYPVTRSSKHSPSKHAFPSSQKLDYDTRAIDLNTFVKNLKTS